MNLRVPSVGLGSDLFCFHFHKFPAQMAALAESYGVPACDGWYTIDFATPGIVQLCEWEETANGQRCKPQQKRHCIEVRAVLGRG